MSLRSSVLGVSLALSLAACGSSPTDTADAGLRRLGESELQVTVDSVVGGFDPSRITFAAFTLKNVSGEPLIVAGCIEGLAAAIEREVSGEWRLLGGNWCWGSDPRHGFPLAAGATIEGAMQVPEPGRYRVRARYVSQADRDAALDAASAPFDAR